MAKKSPFDFHHFCLTNSDVKHFITSGVITKPLLNLTDVAEQIGEGNYDQDISALIEQGRFIDEIDKLSNVFEVMVGKVAEREQTLRKRVKQLEIIVDNTKRQDEVNQIVESDFFQELQTKVKTMRKRFEDGGEEGQE